MAATTWDPANKGSVITLSSGNLVASTSSAITQSVLATRTLTGPSYWEVTATALSTTMGIGVANHIANVNSGPPGADANSVGFRNSGAVVLGGSTVATIQSYSAGSVVQVAVNPLTKLIWFNVNNGNWNNNGSNNPATGVGGIDISALVGGPLLPIAGFTNATTSTVTAVFSSGFAFTPPTGFITPDTCAAVSFDADVAIGGSFLAVAAARQDPVTTTARRSSLPVAAGAFYGTSRFLPQWSPAAAPKSISGTVTELTVPVAKIVKLYNRATGDFIAQTISDPSTGAYSFPDLNPAITYEVIAFDLPSFNALIFDNVAPA